MYFLYIFHAQQTCRDKLRPIIIIELLSFSATATQFSTDVMVKFNSDVYSSPDLLQPDTSNNKYS